MLEKPVASGKPNAVIVRSRGSCFRTKAIPTLVAERLKDRVGVPLYETVQSMSAALDALQFWEVIEAGGKSVTTVARGFCQVTNVGSAVSGNRPKGCGCPATPL